MRDPESVFNFSNTPKLFRRRRDTVETNPHLSEHLAIMDELGVEGMSGDESGGEDGSCNVLRPPWRSEMLSDWLHVIDTVYIRGRMKSGDRRGCLPHSRVYQDDSISSKGQCVKGLPKSAYDPTWLRSGVDVGKTEEVYSFMHASKLFGTSSVGWTQ